VLQELSRYYMVIECKSGCEFNKSDVLTIELFGYISISRSLEIGYSITTTYKGVKETKIQESRHEITQ